MAKDASNLYGDYLDGLELGQRQREARQRATYEEWQRELGAATTTADTADVAAARTADIAKAHAEVADKAAHEQRQRVEKLNTRLLQMFDSLAQCRNDMAADRRVVDCLKLRVDTMADAIGVSAHASESRRLAEIRGVAQYNALAKELQDSMHGIHGAIQTGPASPGDVGRVSWLHDPDGIKAPNICLEAGPGIAALPAKRQPALAWLDEDLLCEDA